MKTRLLYYLIIIEKATFNIFNFRCSNLYSATGNSRLLFRPVFSKYIAFVSFQLIYYQFAFRVIRRSNYFHDRRNAAIVIAITPVIIIVVEVPLVLSVGINNRAVAYATRLKTV